MSGGAGAAGIAARDAEGTRNMSLYGGWHTKSIEIPTLGVEEEYQVVNVAALAELFPQGGEITVADLVAKGAVRNGFPVKVLGDGEVSAAYTLKGVKASASAKSKIEAAGGSISED